jgi:Dolichyl-phosphate-mannose-protein mannosyltransferase
MPERSDFFSYLKNRPGIVSLLMVATCGLVLAFFIGKTYFDPTPRVYALDFGTAHWIEAAKASPCNYFRKDIYISGQVDRGWIEIAATDNFSLYVNDRRIDVRNYYGICTSGIYDLKKIFKPGKNTVAVSVERISFPGSAQLLVRAFFGVKGAPLQEFVSDQTWRASNTPDGIVGGYLWHATALDDTFWLYAKRAGTEGRFPAIEWVTLDPRLFDRSPTAKWIAPSEISARQTSFEGRLRLPKRRQETWLQVAATGDYDLIINGRLVASQPYSTYSVVRNVAPQPYATEVSGAFVQVNPSAAQTIEGVSPPQPFSTQPILLAYDLSRWLHTGQNSVSVRVHSTGQPAMVLVDGYTVLPHGETRWFGTGGDWQAIAAGQISVSPAVAVADYGGQPWGSLQQAPAGAVTNPSYDLQMGLMWVGLIAAVESALIFFWFFVPILAGIITRYPVEKLWTRSAVAQLCLLAVMFCCWLLSFDVRFRSNWCYEPKFILGFILIIAAGNILLFLPHRRVQSQETGATASALRQPGWWSRYWKVIALTGIVLIGFGLRLHDLGVLSLDVDEMGVIQFSHGIQKRGYPFIQIGPFEREVTTYELVSYSIATARQFLGESEAACRTPSLIYSTLTILMMGVVGYRLMGWRVGLVAALIYALFPAGLFWGRNAFWPSQDQLFALTSIWCFYEAARPGPLRHGFLTVSSIAFCLTYLTWEGSGFLLPAFIVCMFVLRWGEYQWMKDWHLWRCCIVVSFVVLIQLTHRQVASLPIFLQTGNSLSEVTTPQLVPLDLTKFNPFYYFYWMLFAENYCVVTLLCILGILFCWRDLGIRYLFVLTLSLLICYIEFLPAYAVRYSYDYQATLILLSVGIFFKLWDAITGLDSGWLKWVGATALFTLFILSANQFVLKTYRLSANPTEPFYGERMGLYRADARTPSRFVAEHIRSGDGVVVAIPHMFEYYAKRKGDYSINTMLNNKITYDGSMAVPHYIDKFRGYPVIRGIEELQYLRSVYKRLWIVRTGATWSNPEVEQYFNRNSRVVFQSYRSMVNLFDGEPGVSRQN